MGLAISYSLSIAGALRRFLSNVTAMEKDMCSVERVQSYLLDAQDLPAGEEERVSEELAAGEDDKERREMKEAPFLLLPAQRSGVELKNVEVRYRTYTAEDEGASSAQRQDAENLFVVSREQQKAAAGAQAGRQTTRDLEANEAATAAVAAGHRPAFLLKPSIIDLSAHVKPGERIGIVGRTGAGKSTLLQALYGLVPCHKGVILIDGVSMKQLPRNTIKQIVGTLPQRSLVFKDSSIAACMHCRTMPFNLWTLHPKQLFMRIVANLCDTCEQRRHSDEEMWRALAAVGLEGVVRSLPGGLELSTVICGGNGSTAGFLSPNVNNLHTALGGTSRGARDRTKAETLSARQMRYLALARLILQEEQLRVVLIDEPPAEELWEEVVSPLSAGEEGEGGVRTEHGSGISTGGRPMASILKDHFKECCVFIVAHHIASLRGCDRVWVLARGIKAAECLPSAIDSESKFNDFVSKCMQKTK